MLTSPRIKTSVHGASYGEVMGIKLRVNELMHRFSNEEVAELLTAAGIAVKDSLNNRAILEGFFTN